MNPAEKLGTCKYENCNSKNLEFEETPQSVHYGRVDCVKCSRFQKWVSNPNRNDSNNKRNTEIKEVIKNRGYEKPFCFWCARTKEQLGYNETLEVDHIRELTDGGKDRVENCRVVCTKCHKQRNHDKLYIKEHLSKFYESGEKV